METWRQFCWAPGELVCLVPGRIILRNPSLGAMWPQVCLFVQLFGLCPDIGLSDYIFWGIGLGFCHKLWSSSLFSLVRVFFGSFGWRLGSPGFFLLKSFFYVLPDFFEWAFYALLWVIGQSSRFNTPSCFSVPDSSSCVAQVPKQDVFIFRDFFAYFRNIFYRSLLGKKCWVSWGTTQWQPDRASSSGTTAVPASPMCAQVNILKPHQTQHAPTPLVRGLDPNCPQIVYSQVQLFLWRWSGEVCWERKHRQVRNITRGMSWVSGALFSITYNYTTTTPDICYGSHGNTRVNFFWPV